jgi:predicted enzyme related to lactoylglutathione lyase
MPRPIHFEIHAANPQRAQSFYSQMFGWEFSAFGPPGQYWVVKTGQGPGIDGGLIQRRGPDPHDGQSVNAFVCTVDVPALDVAVEKAQSLGATLALPKMPIPGIGWLAYVKDTEGNLLGMITMDPSATP